MKSFLKIILVIITTISAPSAYGMFTASKIANTRFIKECIGLIAAVCAGKAGAEFVDAKEKKWLAITQQIQSIQKEIDTKKSQDKNTDDEEVSLQYLGQKREEAYRFALLSKCVHGSLENAVIALENKKDNCPTTDTHHKPFLSK